MAEPIILEELIKNDLDNIISLMLVVHPAQANATNRSPVFDEKFGPGLLIARVAGPLEKAKTRGDAGHVAHIDNSFGWKT